MKYKEVIEDEKLKQFVLGSLLGDGSIPKKDINSKNYRMTFGHSIKQLEYLNWKVQLLEEYELSTGTITKVVSKSDRYNNGECISYHHKSRTNPYFTEYREKFYINNKKILDKSIHDLNVFGLSIWFMDDGYITIDKSRKNKSFYKISTDSFSISELNSLIRMMFNNFDLRVTINYGRELRISEKDNEKFLNLIFPYILPIFYYKLHRVLYKSDEFSEQPEVVNTEPSL